MRGFPKTIGTRQDLEYLLATPEFKEQAEAELGELEAAKNIWVVARELDKGDPGLESASYQVVTQVEADGKEKRYQMELREDPMSKYVRLELADLKKAEPELGAEGVKDA